MFINVRKTIWEEILHKFPSGRKQRDNSAVYFVCVCVCFTFTFSLFFLCIFYSSKFLNFPMTIIVIIVGGGAAETQE